MLSEKEINEVYDQYEKNLHVNIKLPNLLILPKRNQIGMAHIGSITPDFVELFLGDVFFENAVNKKICIKSYIMSLHILLIV